MDVTICILMCRPLWVPWAIHQTRKQYDYLKAKNFSINVLIGVTKMEVDAVKPYLGLLLDQFAIDTRIIRLDDSDNLGQLRTTLCEKVSECSKYITFLDDDDWYPDYRIYRQFIQIDVVKAKYHLDVMSVDKFLCYDIHRDESYWATQASESVLFFTQKYFLDSDGFSGPSSEAMQFVAASDVLMDDQVELIVALQHGANTASRGRTTHCCKGLPKEIHFSQWERDEINRIRAATR